MDHRKHGNSSDNSDKLYLYFKFMEFKTHGPHYNIYYVNKNTIYTWRFQKGQCRIPLAPASESVPEYTIYRVMYTYVAIYAYIQI